MRQRQRKEHRGRSPGRQRRSVDTPQSQRYQHFVDPRTTHIGSSSTGMIKNENYEQYRQQHQPSLFGLLRSHERLQSSSLNQSYPHQAGSPVITHPLRRRGGGRRASPSLSLSPSSSSPVFDVSHPAGLTPTLLEFQETIKGEVRERTAGVRRVHISQRITLPRAPGIPSVTGQVVASTLISLMLGTFFHVMFAFGAAYYGVLVDLFPVKTSRDERKSAPPGYHTLHVMAAAFSGAAVEVCISPIFCGPSLHYHLMTSIESTHCI